MTTELEHAAIGIKDDDRAGMIAALAAVLANQHVLYIKLRNFHWNLTGIRFHPLHEFFEKQYRVVETAIDDCAERIRMLGGVAPGSMSEFLQLAGLDEARGELVSGNDALAALIGDHEVCIRSLRDTIKLAENRFSDVGTGDFLTGLLRQHEEDAWMLRSFLDLPRDNQPTT